MEKEKILEILNDWNFCRKDINTGIKRERHIKTLSDYEKNRTNNCNYWCSQGRKINYNKISKRSFERKYFLFLNYL